MAKEADSTLNSSSVSLCLVPGVAATATAATATAAAGWGLLIFKFRALLICSKHPPKQAGKQASRQASSCP